MNHGKIYVIGIGPGGQEQMTARALHALEQCSCVAGYGLYLDLIPIFFIIIDKLLLFF